MSRPASGRGQPRAPWPIDRLGLPPSTGLLMVVLYLGGVVYGIYFKMVLGQGWAVSAPNLAAIAAMTALTALYLQGRLRFGVVFHAACVMGALMSAAEGLWWQFGNQANALLMVNLSAGCALLFTSLLVLFGSAPLGFGLLGAGLALYAAESFILNSRYSLLALGLVLPSQIAFCLVLWFARCHAPDRAAADGGAVQPPEFDLGACGLTAIELRYVGHIAAGKGSKEIARLEGVTVSTVNNRFSGIYRKTGAADRLDLLRLVGESAAD